jgi:hypothetical protein
MGELRIDLRPHEAEVQGSTLSLVALAENMGSVEYCTANPVTAAALSQINVGAAMVQGLPLAQQLGT